MLLRKPYYLLLLLALLIISGCSEMKIIGDAAMRELSADGINVEKTAMRSNKN